MCGFRGFCLPMYQPFWAFVCTHVTAVSVWSRINAFVFFVLSQVRFTNSAWRPSVTPTEYTPCLGSLILHFAGAVNFLLLFLWRKCTIISLIRDIPRCSGASCVSYERLLRIEPCRAFIEPRLDLYRALIQSLWCLHATVLRRPY
jgi:hypothetical protein